jgi:hypothetical protein
MLHHDINKVLIINTKKTKPEIKALTAHFKGRLIFALVNPDAHEILSELSVVKKRPDLLVY